MYESWLFFRATIDNSVLALVKSNLPVFRRYLAAAGDDPAMGEVAEMLIGEFQEATKAILGVTESEKLLDSTPWLQSSIVVRNRYVDPLNLVQVELLRRRQKALATGEGSEESLEELSQLTIKGIAAGMRTTG
jgi:phosphoenolpyruvate carboxylase